MRVLHRIDRLLSRTCGEWVFVIGLVLWLAVSVASSTLPWLFIPSRVGKLTRYLALAMVVGWYLVRKRVHPAAIIVFICFACAVFILSRSTRMLKYSVIALIPITDVLPSMKIVRNRRKWLLVVLSILLMISAANAESPTLMDACIIVFAARGIEFKRLAFIALIVTAVIVSAVFAGAATGVIADYFMGGGRPRYFMGFSYALFPAHYLFLITCLVCYLAGTRINWVEVAALLVANYVVYALTDSRTSFVCSLAVIIAAVIAKYAGGRLPQGSYCSQLFMALTVACAVVAIAAPVLYRGDVTWMGRLNQLLGGRLQLQHDALQHYGIPLLGQHVELVGNGLSSLSSPLQSGGYNYIDSVYVKMLVLYGPVFTVLYIWIQALITYQAYENGDFLLAFILLLVAAQGILDDAALLLQYNTFILLASSLMGASPRPRRGVFAVKTQEVDVLHEIGTSHVD